MVRVRIELVRPEGNGSRTCSAPMCARHATEVGPATHHCPEHRAVLGLFDGR